MIDWKQMPYFLAVARSGSLRAAAEQLNATHATVRRQVQALEGGYGVQLFRRSRDGLALTPAGRVLLPDALAAEKLLVKAQNGLKGLDREASGLIRISVDPMMGHLLMAPIIAKFCDVFPDIELEIRLTYAVEDINRLETDVSIRNAAEITQDVVARKLFPSDSGIYASRDYIDRHLPNAGPKGENLTWIGYGEVPEQRVWIEGSPFPKAKLRHIVLDTEMHLHMVKAGCGMTYLPIWCAQVYPELQRVPGTDLTHNRHIWVLLHADLARVARVRIFVDFLVQALLDSREGNHG